MKGQVGVKSHASLYDVSKGDVLAAALLVAVCVAAIFFLYGRPASAGERTALMYVNGRKVRELALTEPATVTQRADPVTLTLQLEVGRLRVSESDCPKGVCRERGWISGPGETIVCLPGKVLIEVQGERRADDCDAVTH